MSLKQLMILLIGLLPIIACQEPLQNSTVHFKPEVLPIIKHIIQVDEDTILRTPQGMEIEILKNSIEVPSGNTVTLEIQEAFEMEDIVKAGLTTTSNGEPLSSDGMFNINTTTKGAQVIKAIKIRTPTTDANPDMNIFTGEKDENGNLNWTNPQPLSPDRKKSTEELRIEHGGQLFTEKCASCHNQNQLDTDLTGPSLAHISKIRDRCWLYDFTRHSQKMIVERDPQANCLWDNWGPTVMNDFPELTDEDLDALYDFIEIESDRQNIPVPQYTYNDFIDACTKRWAKIAELDIDSEIYQRYFIEEDTASKYQTTIRQTPSNVLAIPRNMPEFDLVEPVRKKASYYSFDIQTFGWYNVDIFMKDNGWEDHNLLVDVQGIYKDDVEVYLVVPAIKVFIDGGKAEDGKNYAFFEKDGRLPLPNKAQGWIYAFGEEKGQIYLSLVPFIAEKEMRITVEPVKGTKEDLEAAFSIMSSELKLKVEDTGLKIYDELKEKLDSEIIEIEDAIAAIQAESLINGFCDCPTMEKIAMYHPYECEDVYEGSAEHSFAGAGDELINQTDYTNGDDEWGGFD